MILHTDFHDYYDHAIGYGVDHKVHYNRFTEEAEILIKSQFEFPDYSNVGLLGFCGKIYPFIKVERFDKKYDCEYDSDDYKIIEHFHAFSFEEYKQKESEWEEYSNDFGYYDRELLKLKQFFVDWASQDDEIFRAHKVPVWTVNLDRNKHRGLLNPKLKDYGFDRIKDALTAFQDISMYVANILVEQKEIASVEDKFRIEQHGFDMKKSFRKEKE